MKLIKQCLCLPPVKYMHCAIKRGGVLDVPLAAAVIFAIFITSLVFMACENSAQKVYVTDYIELPPEGTAIASAEELAKIGVDAAYPLDGAYYLAADIDLAGFGDWPPIGSGVDEDHYFTGVFDGHGKAIKNLRLADNDNTYNGLFGNVESAVIKNLKVELFQKTIIDTLISSSSTNYQYYGPVAAYAKGTVFFNVSTAGELNIVQSAQVVIGGIAGRALSSVFENCESSVNIISKGPYTIYGGGAVGYLESYPTPNLSSINSFKYNGSIDLNLTGTSAYNVYAGGAAGYSSNSSISQCDVSSEIKVQTRASQYSAAGGIAGYFSGSYGVLISRCSVHGAININRTSGSGPNYAGLIAAYCIDNNGTASTPGNQLNIEYSFAEGSVSINSAGSGDVYAGGISGYTGSIESSYVNGTIYATGGGTGVVDAGGICGYAYGMINSNYAMGSVTAVCTSTGQVNSGGLFGAAQDASNNVMCYNAALSVDTENTICAVGSYASKAPARILGTAKPASCTLKSNIARDTIKVSKRDSEDAEWTDVSQPGDDEDTLDTVNGQSVTASDINQALFEETLKWDFISVWKWDDTLKRPRLQWETRREL